MKTDGYLKGIFTGLTGKWIILFLMLAFIDVFAFFVLLPSEKHPDATLHFEFSSDRDMIVRLYYSATMEFSEDYASDSIYSFTPEPLNMNIHFGSESKYIRIDPGDGDGVVNISGIKVLIGAHSFPISCDRIFNPYVTNGIESISETDDGVQIITSGEDPWIVIDISDFNLLETYKSGTRIRDIIYCLLQILLLDTGLLLLFLCVMKKGKVQDTEPIDNGSLPLSIYQWILIISVFIILVSGSLMLSIDYCPDEEGRWPINEFIFRYGKLPTGVEKELMLIPWGYSYALHPYLSSMIGGFLMRMASVFTRSADVIRLMGRMCSILSITGTCYFIQKTGNTLFKNRSSSVLMAVIICFMPQVMFLGMYLNNDALSLLFVSMEVFFLVRGNKKQWDYASCAGLGLSMAIGLLSYYSVYSWLLFGGIFFLFSLINIVQGDNKSIYILKSMLLVAAIVFVCAGWFFIRNAMLHNGDFLGLSTANAMANRKLTNYDSVYRSASQWTSSVFDLLSARDFDWLRLTTRSFVGMFGYMNILMPQWHYGEYYMLIFIAFIIFAIVMVKRLKDKQTVMFIVFMKASSLLTVILSLIQSYSRDYEPQGRYIISVVVLIGYVFAFGMDNIKLMPDDSGSNESVDDTGSRIKTPDIAKAVALLWILMFIRCYFQTMTMMFV